MEPRQNGIDPGALSGGSPKMDKHRHKQQPGPTRMLAPGGNQNQSRAHDKREQQGVDDGGVRRGVVSAERPQNAGQAKPERAGQMPGGPQNPDVARLQRRGRLLRNDPRLAQLLEDEDLAEYRVNDTDQDGDYRCG